MIKSYKSLTEKYMKANKKRTMLTIIGIVLSVALIASIGLFLQGIQTAEITSFKNDYGSWHVEYTKVSKSLISKITNNPKISKSGMLEKASSISLKDGISLLPITASGDALDLLTYKISQGRMPGNSNEVALEKWTLNYIKKGIKVGDTLQLGNKNYKLVGILENNIKDQYSNNGVLLSKSSNIDINKAVLLVEVNSNTNLKEAVSELDKLSDSKTVTNNTHVIELEGGSSDFISRGLAGVVSVIIGIIVIATIAVIYNSFQISVVERIKQFGLLRAVGMTPRQLRNMVIREATFLAVIGIPIGLILGIIAIFGIKIAFHFIGADEVMPMEITISPFVMLISAAIGMASVYISAMIPAFFAGRISPLVAISSRSSISKEKIKRRKNRIIGRLLGFEGQLAAKNLKRNRKRYRITIFSIIISVVLFVTFKAFMDMTLKLNENVNGNVQSSFTVRSIKSDGTIDSSIIEKVKALDTVSKVYELYMPAPFKEYFDSNSEMSQLKGYDGVYNKESINGMQKAELDEGVVTTYDEASMEEAKKYLVAGTIDTSKINAEDGVILVNNSSVHDKSLKKRYSGTIVNMKVNDEIWLKDANGNDIKKVKVAAILNEDPFNNSFEGNGMELITTKEVSEKLEGLKDIKPVGLNIQIINSNMEDEAKNQIETAIEDNPSLNIIDNIDNNRQTQSAILMIEILIYGFVIVISLISSVNIINTLTTNIILRKREFAALKAIGLTQKGLRKMIIIEGLLYGVIGTIIGSIIASFLSYLLYSTIKGIQDFPWSIPWNGILIAAVAALVIGYLSVLAPLARINKDNIIETIREDG